MSNQQTYREVLAAIRNGRQQTLALLERRGAVLPDLTPQGELTDDAARQLWEAMAGYQSVDDIERFLQS